MGNNEKMQLALNANDAGKRWEMKAEEKLKEIRELVDQQAEDFLLWYIPLDLKQTRQEIHLQNELRKLHALIEE